MRTERRGSDRSIEAKMLYLVARSLLGNNVASGSLRDLFHDMVESGISLIEHFVCMYNHL
ncbi:hypothetical protein [Chroococcidiopsis sp. SAG 2025]|uniref:hypothetical protein n=1 Tax=Chroococcidiopsis sp. SAG 2025 TaxID=171389 RepID=UPI002936E6FA|nr:hypothetical protein [Chroococcidiopsis sp. SAG 2025]